MQLGPLTIEQGRDRAIRFLNELADITGDKRLVHAARVILQRPSSGRPPKKDDDRLDAIKTLIRGGVERTRAIATIVRNEGLQARDRERLSRKLNQEGDDPRFRRRKRRTPNFTAKSVLVQIKRKELLHHD